MCITDCSGTIVIKKDGDFFVLFFPQTHSLYQGVCMDRDKVKTENIFKTEDNEERKEAVLAGLISLVEKDLEKGVQTQAIAHLHKK